MLPFFVKVRAIICAFICSAVLVGCGTAPQSPYLSINLFDSKNFDRGLLDGSNTQIDFNRLTNPETGDQYALEIVATTKFETIVKLLKGKPDSNFQSASSYYSTKLKQPDALSDESIKSYLKDKSIWSVIYFQANVGRHLRPWDTYNREDPRYTALMKIVDPTRPLPSITPLHKRQQSINAAWKVLGYAVVYADALSNLSSQSIENVWSGNLRTQVAGQTMDDEAFGEMGCGAYFYQQADLARRVAVLGESGGKFSQAVSNFGVKPYGNTIWSREKCAAAIDSIPEVRKSLMKIMQKISGGK